MENKSNNENKESGLPQIPQKANRIVQIIAILIIFLLIYIYIGRFDFGKLSPLSNLPGKNQEEQSGGYFGEL